jgi:hypothetical protein
MRKSITKLALAAMLATFGGVAANAATTFTAEYWDVAPQSGNPADTGVPALNPTAGSYLSTVDSILGSRGADATFVSTGINYLGDQTTAQTMSSFLGADAGGLGALGGNAVLGTILRFAGTISLNAGLNNFDIYSDDGFRLIIDGNVVNFFDALRPPSSSNFDFFAGAAGDHSFELVYFETQVVLAALAVKVNGSYLTPAAVPLPAGGLLLLSTLAGLAGLRRRRRS